MRVIWRGVIAAVLVFGCGTAWADSPEERLERVLDGFEESVLWVGNYHQIGAVVARWTHPIHVVFSGHADDNVQALAMETIQRLAAMANVPVEVLPPGADGGDFLIEYQQSDMVYASDGARGHCLSSNKWDGAGQLTRVKLTISTWGPNVFKLPRCVRHEALHGMGLLGHPHQLDSILSYTFNRDDYTEDDVLLLELLYATKNGLHHLPALLAARSELARRLNIAPDAAAQLGGKVFDKELARMTEAAEKGNAAMQVQLGAAYAFGHYVEKQPEKALPLFRSAAASGSRDGQFRLAYALASGSGTAKNMLEAARLYAEAARKGHATARNNLGIFYRDGVAVPADPVTAWALFDLAAKQGNENAVAHREAMRLSEAERELALTRQGEWREPKDASPSQ